MNAALLEKPRSIGERIRSARKDMGLNQADLAVRVGVSQPAVANWESGVHDPRRLMLAKIAEALRVSPEYLAGGARSQHEADSQPAAAYLRRPLRHTPVIRLSDATRILADAKADPHAMALDYIPTTTGAEKVFGFFVDDEAVDLAFPKDTLIVIDYADRRPPDGAFGLFMLGGAPVIRRWREAPMRLEPASRSAAFGPYYVERMPTVIGCVRVSIRFH